MARTERVKKKCDGTAYYHLMSRTNDRRFLFEKGELKTELVAALRRAAEFCGIELKAYAAMDNHFHVVVTVEKPAGPIGAWGASSRSALAWCSGTRRSCWRRRSPLGAGSVPAECAPIPSARSAGRRTDGGSRRPRGGYLAETRGKTAENESKPGVHDCCAAGYAERSADKEPCLQPEEETFGILRDRPHDRPVFRVFRGCRA